MKVLIAPDKFKGSLSAAKVGGAIREGILDADPSVECTIVPLADGGEGTTEVLTRHAQGTIQRAVARDPLYRPIEAEYGLSHDGRTAFIEMASASGLALLRAEERDPQQASTIGTGDLIRHALDRGVRNVCLGIGGSATNDGGTGAMVALGVKFYDDSGNLLKGTGRELQEIARIDTSDIHPSMKDARFTIFCDVDNPLYGPRGAAFVFGPQKGATSATVSLLDDGLRHYERLLQRIGYTNILFPGAGAGGGMPVALAVFGCSVIRSGIEYIMEFVDLPQGIADADLVITGEGRLDDQTLSGKVVKGVAALAYQGGKPVLAVAGSVSLKEDDLRGLHIHETLSLVNAQTTTEVAIKNAESLIRARLAAYFKR